MPARRCLGMQDGIPWARQHRSSKGNASRLQICPHVAWETKGVLSHDDVPILPFARTPRTCVVRSSR